MSDSNQLPGRPDYFRGGITVSSLTPLRWIPFRVICLLGMDQSAFGSMSAPGDDLVAATPDLGDPDPRAEMRQSLLEAVLAAGDHLIVVRDGHDVRTNQQVPRAVVMAELFDAVSRWSNLTAVRSLPTHSRSTTPVRRSTHAASRRTPSFPRAVGVRHEESGRRTGPSGPGPTRDPLPSFAARTGR